VREKLCEEQQREKNSNMRGMAMWEEWQHVRNDNMRKGSVKKTIMQKELHEEQQ
jgi:hypothetical protein